MSTIEIWWIGIALAMDCFAISIACGICSRKFLPAIMISMVMAFGAFQGGMFLGGYGCASLLSVYFTMIGKWIAVALLIVLGVKMIWDDINPKDEKQINLLSIKSIPVLAFATSIDAMAIGISFSCLQNMSINRILYAGAIIAFCSTFLSIIGILIGILIGEKLRFPTSFIGGIILVFIAIKMIIEYFTGI